MFCTLRLLCSSTLSLSLAHSQTRQTRRARTGEFAMCHASPPPHVLHDHFRPLTKAAAAATAPTEIKPIAVQLSTLKRSVRLCRSTFSECKCVAVASIRDCVARCSSAFQSLDCVRIRTIYWFQSQYVTVFVCSSAANYCLDFWMWITTLRLPQNRNRTLHATAATTKLLTAFREYILSGTESDWLFELFVVNGRAFILLFDFGWWHSTVCLVELNAVSWIYRFIISFIVEFSFCRRHRFSNETNKKIDDRSMISYDHKSVAKAKQRTFLRLKWVLAPTIIYNSSRLTWLNLFHYQLGWEN